MLTDDQIASMSVEARRELIMRLAAPTDEVTPGARWLMRTREVRMAVLGLATVVMVPWTIYLAFSLPRRYLAHNWDAVWVGFDTLEIALLVATAVLGFLRRQLVMLTAFTLGVILLTDAWFDVLTSNDVDRPISVLSPCSSRSRWRVMMITVAVQLLRIVAIRLWSLDPRRPLWDIAIPLPKDVAPGRPPTPPVSGAEAGPRARRPCARRPAAIWATRGSTPSNFDHPAEAGDEGDLDELVVEVEALPVQDVGLDAPLPLAVERRVGADADRRRHRLAAWRLEAAQPAGVDPVRGRGHVPRRDVGRGVAELAAAQVTARDMTHDGERPAQGFGCALDVAGSETRADVRRGPDLGAAVERDALGREVAGRPRLPQGGDVARSPCTEAEVGADDDVRGVQGVDEHAVDELLGRPGSDLARERDHEDVVHAGLAQQLAALVDPGERARRVFGAQHRHRVRVEGDRDDEESLGVGDLPRASYDVPVAEVDPVEVADHDDGATEVGRHVVDGSPDAHSPRLARSEPVAHPGHNDEPTASSWRCSRTSSSSSSGRSVGVGLVIRATRSSNACAGGAVASSSRIVVPSANTSAAGVTRPSSSSSGGMYAVVPGAPCPP